MRNQGTNSKPSVAARIIQGLQEFTNVLESGEDITKHFKCTTVHIDLAPQSYNSTRVKNVRELLGTSQEMLAMLLGISVKTVRSWEQGIRTPGATACRFMDEIQRDPPYWIKRLKEAVVVK